MYQTIHLISSYILLVLCLLALLGLGYYFVSGLIAMVLTKGVPYVPTYNADLKYFKNLDIKPDTTMIDLGCGDGKMLRFFVKNYNLKQADGYEINGFAVNYGKFLNKIGKYSNINLYKKNFKNIDLSKYDYVFVYLLPETMKAFEERIFQSVGENTIIIANTFSFASHTPFFTVKNKNGNTRVLFYKK